MPIQAQDKPDSVGFQKLLSLQDSTEKMITGDPSISEAVRELMWKIYQNGQDAGVIQGLLRVSKTMQEAGFPSKIIMQITRLPVSDLEMWQEASQDDRDSK